MAEPYNYNVASPMAGFVQGFNVGTVLDEQRKAQEVEQRAREGEAALLMAFEGGTPTTEQISNLILKNPSIADRAKQAYTMRTAPQREADERQRTQLYMLMRSGETDAVKAQMQAFADAARNSGREQEAAQAEANLRVYEQNPNAGMISVGSLIAATNPELWNKLSQTEKLQAETGETLAKGAKARAELRGTEAESTKKTVEAAFAPVLAQLEVEGKQAGIAQTRAQIQNIASAIRERANNYNLSVQRLAADTANVVSQINERQGKLPDAVLKVVNEAALNGATAQQQSANNIDLANKIAKANLTGVRTFGQLGETFRRQFGVDITTKALRGEIERARNSAAVASLPPGTASDRDISLFLGPIPDSFSNPAELQSYFRGLAKAQAITGAVETARADWMAQNRGMLAGKATQPMTVGDYTIKPGQSFSDLSKGIAVAVTRKMAGTAKAPTIAPTPSGTMPAAGAGGFRVVGRRAG